MSPLTTTNCFFMRTKSFSLDMGVMQICFSRAVISEGNIDLEVTGEDLPVRLTAACVCVLGSQNSAHSCFNRWGPIDSLR